MKKEPLRLWNKKIKNDLDLDAVSTREGRPNYLFNHKFIYLDRVANTITANDNCCLFIEPRYRSKKELSLIGSFPLDYNFLNNEPAYLIGMSIPPVMIAQISNEI